MPTEYESLAEVVKKLLVSDPVQVCEYIARLRISEDSEDSENQHDSGYGESLQMVPYVKNIGIQNLLGLFEYRPGDVLLDVLGGAGQVSIAARTYRLSPFEASIVTADADLGSVHSVASRGLPAVPLDPRDMSIIREGSLSSVMLAHHVHHLSPSDRSVAVREAASRLRPGGTLVIYEGPRGGTTARLSDYIVDQLSETSHRYLHPTLDQLLDIVPSTLVDDVEALWIESPLIFLGRDADEARRRALAYYIRHYSLYEFISWDVLREHMEDAYSGMSIKDTLSQSATGRSHQSQLYVGPTDHRLLQQLFPTPTAAPMPEASFCVVVPRDGVAIRVRRA